MTNRPPISEEVKRQVRQECLFGCVICGMPIFQYDHIVDYSERPAHEPENIALLCPNHHMDKTAGRLSRASVAQARRAPFNSLENSTSEYILNATQGVELWLGSNQIYISEIVANYSVLQINGKDFLAIHRIGESLTYSAIVTDEQGGQLLRIDRGELVVATNVWDYRYEGKHLSIRRAQGEIIFEAEVSDSEFRIVRGVFVDEFAAGVSVERTGEAIYTMSGLHVGSICRCCFGVGGWGGIEVVRESCYPGALRGFCFHRIWSREYEGRAARMKQALQSGVSGDYPKGLENFEPRTN